MEKSRRYAFVSVRERIQQAWPGIALPVDKFLDFYANTPPFNQTRLDNLFVEELYLAWACLKGDSAALAAFETLYMARVPSMVAKLRFDRASLQELQQELRIKLLFAQQPHTPKLLEYSGQGRLEAWVRIVALRLGFNLLRHKGRHQSQELSEDLALATDMELDYFKREYRLEFQEIFQKAVNTLPPRHRTVLRMHFVDGLSVEQIAQFFRTHRSTIHRWITTSRAQLTQTIHEGLMAKLRISHHELLALSILIKSNFASMIGHVL